MHEGFQGLNDFLQLGQVGGLHHIFTDPEPQCIAVLYRNGYLRACREALEARCPAVVSAMGETEFRTACQAYIQESPPTQRTLTGYGHDFPDWLARFDRALKDPAWADLARLDGAWLDCLYGQDESPLTAEQLNERIQSGDLPVSPRMRHNARMVSLQYPVFDAWVATRQGRANVQLPSNPKPCVALFWRPDMKVLSRQLDAWEFDFYRIFLATDSLEKAVGYFVPKAIKPEDPPITLEQYLAQLIDVGMLTLGE